MSKSSRESMPGSVLREAIVTMSAYPPRPDGDVLSKVLKPRTVTVLPMGWDVRALPTLVTEFTVPGKAEPAGSKKAFVPTDKKGQPFRDRNGRIIVNVVDDNPKSKAWKQHIALVAGMAYKGTPVAGPLRVTITVYRQRPKGHYRTNGDLNKEGLETPYPTTKPDVLKLARGIEDALTGVVWVDDAQIVDEPLKKLWGEPRIEVKVERMGL